MESLIGLAIFVFLIIPMLVAYLVSKANTGYKDQSQKQDPFQVDTLFHVVFKLNVISDVIESVLETTAAIIEGVGSILEVSVDVLDW